MKHRKSNEMTYYLTPRGFMPPSISTSGGGIEDPQQGAGVPAAEACREAREIITGKNQKPKDKLAPKAGSTRAKEMGIQKGI